MSPKRLRDDELTSDDRNSPIERQHVDPPLPSPRPPIIGEDEHPSGSHLIPATLFDVKEAKKTAEAVAESKASDAKQEITKYVAAADVKWFVATMAGVAVAAVVLVGWFDARGQTRVDAGVAPVVSDVADVKKRLDHVEVAVQQEALEHARQSVMLEMLTKDRGMVPPPPAPKVLLPDGGQ